MARDYASGKRNTRKTATRKPAASRSKTAARPRVWRWYGAGVLTGLGAALALYLVTLPPAPGDAGTEAAPVASTQPAAKTPPKPRFDFYTMLPEQTIDVDVDPAEVAQPRATASSSKEIYLLQAGSFRQRADADRRRAELLLLGLEPRVEESSSDNGRWFRVFIGPFDSRSKMAKARSLTAGQDIDTLLLKREG
ncbi:sporulation protein [Parahaliea maris]|uniref:Sporulation protein n=1 Tax=Parahaliea maris TaxID=2716870 RepID=A0A5C8ZZ83_9GAMM|nr:SPOR domain-containing protein [Parahaliea maris]TXS93913.1 sporulation protein [Parahaliea maris]